jgi:hypothetical protein
MLARNPLAQATDTGSDGSKAQRHTVEQIGHVTPLRSWQKLGLERHPPGDDAHNLRK